MAVRAILSAALRMTLLVPALCVFVSAPTTAALKCEIISKFACAKSGCEPNAVGVWNLIDADKMTFSRCDQKGCDHYDMRVTKSGIYFNIIIADRAMFAKMSADGREYVEVTSIGMNVLVSYGSCR